MSDELLKICPPWVSHLLIQCAAGTLGGFTTTLLTNPLDIVRARLQCAAGTLGGFTTTLLTNPLDIVRARLQSVGHPALICFAYLYVRVGHPATRMYMLSLSSLCCRYTRHTRYTTSPPWVSHLLIQCAAGTLGGFTTTLLTNPLDIVRARLQSLSSLCCRYTRHTRYTTSPPWVSHLLIQCAAGTLGGFTTTLLTNPLDIVRARLQTHSLHNKPPWVSHLLIQCAAGTLGGFTTTLLTNPLDIVRARLQCCRYTRHTRYTTSPPWVSHLLIQCAAGTLGGFTTTLLTNPLDIVRARLQCAAGTLGGFTTTLLTNPLDIVRARLQCAAGTLGGFTTTLLTNPLDIVRARLQVEGVGTMRQVFQELWAEEGFVGLYLKGLSARLVQSACFSFSIILGYESIKRVALSEEYRARVRW
ncbi:unnamed protein product [Plutella xylostella]|uniref:(diamondback moth) hypothetical protein n=1 Tax=Plutella xylostella TaxID=51655 RepID=A0A8S4EVC1_PLUXY|nr:unnamed protein product [Plutella xylostella]